MIQIKIKTSGGLTGDAKWSLIPIRGPSRDPGPEIQAGCYFRRKNRTPFINNEEIRGKGFGCYSFFR
jgi:hypothetical protein